MSFDEIYYPGFDYDQSQTAKVRTFLESPLILQAHADETL